MEALQRLHNRGSISTGYDVDNSLKVEADNNEYLERSTSGASDGSSTQHTISVWVKRTELGVDCEPISAGGIGRFRFESDDTFSYQFRSGKELITTQEFRDTSAWYHIVAAADSSQATDSNRMKVYVNGVQVTAFGTANYQDQNQASPAWGKNTTYSLRVGAADSSTRNFSGYIAEAYYIDGQTLDPTYFGEFDDDTAIWKPKKFSGTYGSLDTYLDFSDSSNLGNNASGGTDLTATNITAADQAIDTPTNNFAIINTLQGNSDKLTISNGATKIVKSGDHGWQTTTANIAITEGKWYAEFKLDSSCDLVMLGVNQIQDEYDWNGSHLGAYSNTTAQGMGYYSSNGNFYRNAGSGAIGSSYLSGDIIGIALYITSSSVGYMGMSKNGTWQNSQDPSSGTTNMLGLNYGNAIDEAISYTFAISTHQDAGGVLANFGGFDGFTVSSGNADANGYGNFEYPVPTGYYALCTKNLEEFG